MQTTTIRLINDAVANTLVLAAKAHFWHLTTRSYAAHQALGELYSFLHEVADGLSEPAQGEGLEHSAVALQANFQPYTAAQVIGELENFCSISLGKVLMGIQGNTDLQWYANIVQGFQGDLYKTLYKLKRLA